MDPKCEHWVVGYSEFVAKTVAFVMLNVYENFQLLTLFRRMIKLS